MLFEPIRQVGKSLDGMIVNDGLTRCFPDMLLWVEVRRGSRKANQLQTGIRLQEIPDGLSRVPRCTIPQEYNGHIWDRFSISVLQAHPVMWSTSSVG